MIIGHLAHDYSKSDLGAALLRGLYVWKIKLEWCDEPPRRGTIQVREIAKKSEAENHSLTYCFLHSYHRRFFSHHVDCLGPSACDTIGTCGSALATPRKAAREQ